MTLDIDNKTEIIVSRVEGGLEEYLSGKPDPSTEQIEINDLSSLGGSSLIHKHHDVQQLNDPCGKQSKKMDRANMESIKTDGDGDVWVQKLIQSTRTGRLKLIFQSANTGKRVKNEPPSGASKVVYLNQAFITEAFNLVALTLSSE